MTPAVVEALVVDGCQRAEPLLLASAQLVVADFRGVGARDAVAEVAREGRLSAAAL